MAECKIIYYIVQTLSALEAPFHCHSALKELYQHPLMSF